MTSLISDFMLTKLASDLAILHVKLRYMKEKYQPNADEMRLLIIETNEIERQIQILKDNEA